MPMPPCRKPFPWSQTRSIVEELATVHALRADDRGRLVAGLPDAPELVVRLPAVLPAATGDPLVWCAALPGALGVEVLILLRAGSAALGLWRDDELLLHKVFKRYVVRGHGKAQATHLKQKGKSRYGSRLRLQQAGRLLEETAERLDAWERDEGPFDRIHHAAPPRLWADFLATNPPPPFTAEDPRLRRIGLHAHEPDFAELQRVRHALRHGTVEWSNPAPA
jgi:hypothetical protein